MARLRRLGVQRSLALGLAGLALLLAVAAYVWRDDIMQAARDPKEPFQTYVPPPAPDYGEAGSWALAPETRRPGLGDPAVDVFFVAPTTYDGARHWNAPIDDPDADRFFRHTIAPNYAGPFARVGRIFAPRYRQASLYTLLTLREDAREARRFAYGDVARAFRWYLANDNGGRPFILAGVEQGGTLATRLLAEEVAPNPRVRGLLVAAYLTGTVVPSEAPPITPCVRRAQAGCLAAWASAFVGDRRRPADLRDRSLVWTPTGQLVNLQGRTPLCFNPVLGATTDQAAPARLNLGAVNATGLEWGARPAFLTRQVQAQCMRGVLTVSRPKSASLQITGAWAERKKVPAFNLFYGDIEADAKARVAAWVHAGGSPALSPPPGPPAASRTAPAAP